MCRVVADPELALDDNGYSLGGPDISTKAERFGTACQESRNLGTLLGAQAWLRTWGGPTAQSLDSTLLSSFHPLTDCPLGHAKGDCDVVLIPALLLQLPGAQPTPFDPVVWRCCS